MIVGSRVRIKSWLTIEDTLDRTSHPDELGCLKGENLNFARSMKKFCNMKTRIIGMTNHQTLGYMTYTLEGCELWAWHGDWIYDMSNKRNDFSDELFTL